MKTSFIHTVDCIVQYQNGIVLVERKKEPFGLALPGGHVEDNESLEQAVEREIREETHLKLAGVKQFRTYSEPERDPRYRAISTVFVGNGYGRLEAGDDAQNVLVMPLAEIDQHTDRFAFDHYKILSDYRSTAASPPIQPNQRPEKRHYFVLYEKHSAPEKHKKWGKDSMRYTQLKELTNYEQAMEFAETHMPALLAKRLPLQTGELSLAKDPQKPYVVAGESYYTTCCMGETDTERCYDAVRCSADKLEHAAEELSDWGEKVWRGIELKLV